MQHVSCFDSAIAEYSYMGELLNTQLFIMLQPERLVSIKRRVTKYTHSSGEGSGNVLTISFTERCTSCSSILLV